MPLVTYVDNNALNQQYKKKPKKGFALSDGLGKEIAVNKERDKSSGPATVLTLSKEAQQLLALGKR